MLWCQGIQLQCADIMPMRNIFALALGAMLHGMLTASTASSVHGDCGCAWQQEYTSLHAAIKLGRHAKRYTVVSYPDMGETQSCTGCILIDCLPEHLCVHMNS